MTEVMSLKLLLSRQFQFSMGGHNKRQLGQKKKNLILNFTTYF